MIARLRNWLRARLGGEEGAVTVDFVLMLPMVLTIFFASVEASMMQMRIGMMDRAMELTVRDLRIGSLGVGISHEKLRKVYCDYSMMIPNCERHLKLELSIIDRQNWEGFPELVQCLDRLEEIDPDSINIISTLPNDIVAIRACMVFEPFFPSSRYGLRMRRDESGGIQLATMSAFVNEP